MSNFGQEVKNMGIWDDVCKTNPKYTKDYLVGVNQLTSINPMYLVMRATEKFGPCGIGWGYEILEDKVVDGHPLILSATQCVLAKLHVLKLRLWYKWEGQTGEVFQFGQTPLTYESNGKLFTDEDAPKKSVTDAIGKCLSMLGFGSDVYMGYFNDPHYVERMQQEHDAANAESQPRDEPVDTEVSQQPPVVEEVKTGIDISSFSAMAQDLISRVRSITDPTKISAARAHSVRLTGIEQSTFLAELEATEKRLVAADVAEH